jgi:hypothetical protein
MSISHQGNLNFGNKADLVRCLEESIENAPQVPTLDAVIVDGAAMVNMLRPGVAKTFGEYASQVLVPYLRKLVAKSHRQDVIFDLYFPHSLKANARTKRGSGSRQCECLERMEKISSVHCSIGLSHA